eukprot:6476223-Amphidinium_carterae.1
MQQCGSPFRSWKEGRPFHWVWLLHGNTNCVTNMHTWADKQESKDTGCAAATIALGGLAKRSKAC